VLLSRDVGWFNQRMDRLGSASVYGYVPELIAMALITEAMVANVPEKFAPQAGTPAY
jgi:hypothetical protein